MALATRCPYCSTTFRVANDQLKLRAGVVRCGACKQVFNGVEHLLRSETAAAPSGLQLSSPRPAGTSAAAPDALNSFPVANSSSAPDESSGTSGFLHDGDAEQTNRSEQKESPDSHISTGDKQSPPSSRPDHPSDHERSDPLQHMTLMDFSAFEEDEDARPTGTALDKSPPYQADESTHSFPQNLADTDDLDKTIEELQSKPWRTTKKQRFFAKRVRHEDEYELEPGFVAQAHRRQRIGHAARMAMGAGSAVLILALFGQAVYSFRNQMAARWPESKPVLDQVCNMLGCLIGLPAQIDMLSIESSELQASASDQSGFTLSTLLRNRSAIAQSWPKLELSLNDANDKPIARRVFDPREYLPPAQDAAKGFAPNSEQTVKLDFALSQLKASVYRVYLFYP